MNEIIKVETKRLGESEINVVDGRELHQFLENKYQFSNWITDRIKQYRFTQGVDFIAIKNSVYSPPRKDYWLSIDMAKELAMVEKNEKGKQARRYFIECEERANSVQVPQTEAERILDVALLLRNKVEKEKALSRAEILHMAYLESLKIIEEKDAEIEQENLNIARFPEEAQ